MFVYKELNYLMTSFKCNSQCTQIVIHFILEITVEKADEKGVKIESLGNNM